MAGPKTRAFKIAIEYSISVIHTRNEQSEQIVINIRRFYARLECSLRRKHFLVYK